MSDVRNAASRKWALARLALLLAWASVLLPLHGRALAFKLVTNPGPAEVQLTPLGAPPFELAPFQFRDCKAAVAFFATSSDLTPFIPDELVPLEPPATPGMQLMIAFSGRCPKSTLGPCGFTMILAPVALKLRGHPLNGQLLGVFPLHSFVTNENYYKACDTIGGCALKLGIVDREEVGDQVVFSFSRRDIRPVNENGEFDIDGEVAQEATQLVELVVQSLAPVDDAALLLFEDLTGFPFRNEQGELAFSFPPLVNLKIVPSVEGGLDVAQLTRVPFADQMPGNAKWGPATLSLQSTVWDPIAGNVSVDAVLGGVNFDFGFEFRWPAGETLYDYLEQPPGRRRFPRRLAVRR